MAYVIKCLVNVTDGIDVLTTSKYLFGDAVENMADFVELAIVHPRADLDDLRVPAFAHSAPEVVGGADAEVAAFKFHDVLWFRGVDECLLGFED